MARVRFRTLGRELLKWLKWVKLVVGSLLCSERFLSGFSGFPLSSKINNCKIQFVRMQDLPENHFRVSGASWVKIINYYYIIYISNVLPAFPSILISIFLLLPLDCQTDQSALLPGGGGTPLFGLYGDVPLDRVWFLASLS